MRHKSRGLRSATICALVVSLVVPDPGYAAPEPPVSDLSETSIEELMQLEITSAARRAQTLSKAAAAVYVITAEDIRRSGALSVAEVLRMAPGLQVARIDAQRYAIASRGFNGEFSNKTLVLIDGRSVYMTGTGGVSWETIDTDIESIERIEVIRGAAGAVWGANAVNGVINIITRKAQDTTGNSVEAGAGITDRSLASVRHGASRGKFAYRLYGKTLRRSPLGASTGEGAGKDWVSSRAGFRVDSGSPGESTLTITGDIYDSRAGQDTFTPLKVPPFSTITKEDTRSFGGHLYGRWTRRHRNGSSQFQTFFDRQYSDTERMKPRIDTFDVEYQREIAGSGRHNFLVGGGMRLVAHSYADLFGPALAEKENYGLVSAFVQDDISLVEGILSLTAGAKVEKTNLSSGGNVQPTVRLSWTPSDRQTVWAAISQAKRPASRFEHDVDVLATYTPTPHGLLAVWLSGNEQVQAETVRAAELGYRIQPRKDVSIDVATFHNSYSNLVTLIADPQMRFTPEMVTLNATFKNAYAARTYGGEVTTGWSPFENLRLSGTYTRLRISSLTDSQTFLRKIDNPQGRSPLNQGTFRASYTPRPGHRLDLDLYCVGRLAADNVRAYQRLDIHWDWKLSNHLTLSVLGRDLLRPQHYEFQSEGFATKSPVRRGASVRVRWDF